MLMLVGDVGGSKCHLAIYRNQSCLEEKVYQIKKFIFFSDMLADFLSSFSERIDCACFGVAGPVEEGTCQLTNASWYLQADEIAKEFKIPRVFLINDLEAYGYGLSSLSAEDFVVLHEGEGKGNRIVIAAGTGLGELGLYWDGKDYHPIATEGGQVDFAPRDEREMELLTYLKTKYPHVSYERVVSGPGIVQLFQFYIEYKKEKKPEWVDSVPVDQMPAMISKKGLAFECALSRKVLEWFVSLYAAEAGNLALKYLSKGGVYIAGRMAQKNLPLIQERFFAHFKDKGRFEPLLAQMPVKVVVNENTPLLGALAFIEKKFQIPYGGEYIV